LTLALLDFDRSRVTRLAKVPNPVDRVTAAEKHQSTWQRAALEIAGTFLVLMGIAVGILALRLALILTHGIPNKRTMATKGTEGHHVTLTVKGDRRPP
jgi:hypothetical protein